MALRPGDKGTVTPAENFNPYKDAETLRGAIKGAGTDEATIIDVLTNRSNKQRQLINEAFRKRYKEDLGNWLQKEFLDLSEIHMGIVVSSLMKTPLQYDVECVANALVGAGTDEGTLIEILCTRSFEERQAIMKEYPNQNAFRLTLIEAIKGDTSKGLQKFLLTLITAKRDPSIEMNIKTEQEDAKKLQQGVKGTLEKLFAVRTFTHMHNVIVEYETVTDKPIEEVVKRETVNDYDYQLALLDIITMLKNKDYYFARRLNDMMKGHATTDLGLIRLLVTRCEKDMLNIREEYFRHFGVSLKHAIVVETSGWYSKILIALVRK